MAAPMWIARNVRFLSKTVQDTALKLSAHRRICTFHDQPALLRSRVGPVGPVGPVALIHTGSVSASLSPLITVSEEPDTLFQELTVLVKGHDRAVLDSYEFFATLAAKELGLTLAKVSEPKRNIERFTLLKSVHIFKKHRVQYEMRTHYRCIEIHRITGSTARVYLEYIQRNLPEGVAMEVTKTAIEKIPEHIQKPIWSEKGQEDQASQ
ncbi:small ribosomal subunit protein uS10m [Brachyhypopomus gauderio]|uniref:small ribosomal subunit protein uS10m n=1 Tax=Brachyhypopomus gauderio TaxID=698409 RepID=UPI0040416DF2